MNSLIDTIEIVDAISYWFFMAEISIKIRQFVMIFVSLKFFRCLYGGILYGASILYDSAMEIFKTFSMVTDDDSTIKI